MYLCNFGARARANLLQKFPFPVGQLRLQARTGFFSPRKSAGLSSRSNATSVSPVIKIMILRPSSFRDRAKPRNHERPTGKLVEFLVWVQNRPVFL